jgi:hypothetical protein
MPCHSPSYLTRKEDVLREGYISLELNLTTRFACECLTKLEEENSPIPEYIKDWWEQHKEWDRKRKEIEQTQKDINEDKKWQQIKNAMENGVETLFPSELLNNEN